MHAAGAGLAIDYRATTAEALADAGERFDLVLAMEVVEHVADLGLFVQRCAEMVKPGGLLIGATINRTLKSFALAIVGAEYVLRWLPRGTHRWDKFVTPERIRGRARAPRPARDRADRRGLRSPRRPLAALARHGRELHAGGGEAAGLKPRRLRSPLSRCSISWAWALFTVIAAFSQTVRNAAQRQLTATLGTVGATHVRFLFGFPFALVFLAGVLIAGGDSLPRPGLAYWAWVADGALAQIAATALMLAAMNQRSFVVTIAYIKTEPVQVALFGLILLGDAVTPSLALAILVATAGVVVMSLKPGAAAGGMRPTLSGLAAGAMFGLSAVGFRGAILSLGLPSYLMAATFTLVIGLLLQSVLLVGLSVAARSEGADRHHALLAALAVRRLHGGAGVAVLVPGLRARDRRQRAHAGAGRGAVRAGDLALRVQAADDAARGGRHRADRDRLRVVDLGLVIWSRAARAPTRGAPTDAASVL